MNASAITNGTAVLQATLTVNGFGVSGQSVAFTVNGSSVGSAMTDALGVATLTASVNGLTAGQRYQTAASFAGTEAYQSSSATAALSVGGATPQCSGAAVAVGSAQVVTGSTASVPITVSQLPSTCATLAGWQVTVAYDPSVVAVVGATGGPAWQSITTQTSTPGTVLLAGAQVNGFAGTQVVAELQLKGIGGVGTSSALTSTVQFRASRRGPCIQPVKDRSRKDRAA